jgi:CRISPR-associated protein Cas2
MYVVLVYDINEKRVAKMLKLCRRYLNWIQNSVFEGEITESQLSELIHNAKLFINEKEDSIILFKSRDIKWMYKEIIGLEKGKTDNFL